MTFNSLIGLSILGLICPSPSLGASIQAYDGDHPSHIVELDARGRCAASVPRPEVSGSQVRVTLLNRVSSVRVSGFSCKVKSRTSLPWAGQPICSLR